MTWTIKQSGLSANPPSANTRALPFSASVAAGNMLAAFCISNPAESLIVSDQLNGLWQQAGSYFVANSLSLSWWYLPASVGGKPIVSVTPSASCYLTLAILEAQSPDGLPGMLDAVATASGSGATAVTSQCPAQPGELVLAGYADGTTNLSSLTSGTPFLMLQQFLSVSSQVAGAIAADTNAPGKEAATFIANTAAQWASLVASFRSSAGIPVLNQLQLIYQVLQQIAAGTNTFIPTGA